MNLFADILSRPRNAFEHREVVDALAEHADADTFQLLLQYPLYVEKDEESQAVFAKLGASLVRHPEAADVLLKARMTERDPGPESNFGCTRFAQEVFKHAGKAMLPRLHQALASDDRVVRSNAGRACGAIGDPSSIPPLIQALDMESGLARGSIVWALGKLQALEALPVLASLYLAARNDAVRGAGSGFRAAQGAAQIESQFSRIERLEDIGPDWDELHRQPAPVSVDPLRNEPLLSPEIILAAVRDIGPSASQAFYRQLAGERDVEGRREAAARLAEGDPVDREINRPILRSLLADSNTVVGMTAAVSLLMLGETDVQGSILAWLGSEQTWEVSQMIQQLERVPDGGSLQFAREAIQRVARAGGSALYNGRRVEHLLSRIPSE